MNLDAPDEWMDTGREARKAWMKSFAIEGSIMIVFWPFVAIYCLYSLIYKFLFPSPPSPPIDMNDLPKLIRIE